MKGVTIECEVFAAIARRCEVAYHEQTNPLAVCKTTYSELSRECKLDWRSVRNSLDLLEQHKFVQIRPSGKGIIVMVSESATNKVKTTNLQDAEKKEENKRKNFSSPHTPYLNKKEEKQEEKSVRKGENSHTADASPLLELKERKDAFRLSIEPYVAKYGAQLCNEFFQYWTELTPDGEIMRFELQKTWSVGGRLAKWKRTEWENKPLAKSPAKVEGSKMDPDILAEIEAEKEAARKEREERGKKAASVEEIKKIIGNNWVAD